MYCGHGQVLDVRGPPRHRERSHSMDDQAVLRKRCGSIARRELHAPGEPSSDLAVTVERYDMQDGRLTSDRVRGASHPKRDSASGIDMRGLLDSPARA